MKKISFTMSIFMGLMMSFALSLTGNLLSGHFALPMFVMSFAGSFILSLIIGLIIPMKPLSDKVCGKFGAEQGTIKARIISSLLSTFIYTPVLTTVMVLMMTVMAGKNLDMQIAEKKVENLPVYVFDTREEMGKVAAADAGKRINAVIRESHPKKTLELLAGGQAELGVIRFREEYRQYFSEIAANANLKFQLLKNYEDVILLDKDHPLAQKRVVNLSDATYGSSSVAAVAVAAHEMGHVMQKQDGYLFCFLLLQLLYRYNLDIHCRSCRLFLINFQQIWCVMLINTAG